MNDVLQARLLYASGRPVYQAGVYYRLDPGGFWAVFAGNEWIDAAQPSQEAALAFIGRLKGEAPSA